MKTTMEQLRKADWDGLEADVVQRIRALRHMVMHLERDNQDALDAIANDIVLPNLRLLGTFCESMKVGSQDKQRKEGE